MIKPITLLTTLFIAISPMWLLAFNFSLSFCSDNAVMYECNNAVMHKCRPDFPLNELLRAKNAVMDECSNTFPNSEFSATHFYLPPRKVIKESIIEKHDSLSLPKEAYDYQVRTVVIDPGHGGHDPGCLGGNSHEKHLALAISLELAKAMRAKYPDLNIILTRDKDVFIPLHERAAIANRSHADLFISVHCNYMPGSRATQGSETYVMGLHTAEHNLDVAKRENSAILLEDNYEKNYDYDPHSPEGHILLSMFQNAHLEQSILFAEKVESYFEMAQRKSRGVKQAGFVVLKETAMPSVLVETGFLSNQEEEAFLMEKSGQQLVAKAMLSAFVEYKAIVEGKAIPPFNGFPAVAAYQEPATAPDAARPSPSYKAPMPDNTNISPRGGIPSTAGKKASPKPAEYDEAPVYHVLTKDGKTQESANIQFNVQLAASPRPIDTADEKWQSTGYLIEVVRENNLYKYQARNFSSLQSAFEARLLLQARGFQDAFIVAYKNGQRISMDQARKELGMP